MKEKITKQVKRAISLVLAVAAVFLLTPAPKAEAVSYKLISFRFENDPYASNSTYTMYYSGTTSFQLYWMPDWGNTISIAGGGQTAPTVYVTSRDGNKYEVTGWRTNPSFGVISTGRINNYDFYAPTLDSAGRKITLTPIIERVKHRYYFMDGNNVLFLHTVRDGYKPVRPANPIKSGYTFVGWYTSSSFQTSFNFNTTAYCDNLIYAKFVKNTGNSGGGSSNSGGGNGSSGGGSGNSGGGSNNSKVATYSTTAKVGSSVTLSPGGTPLSGGKWKWDENYMSKAADGSAGKFTAKKQGQTTVTQVVSGKTYIWNVKIVSKNAVIGSADKTKKDKTDKDKEEGQGESIIQQFIDTEKLREAKDLADVVEIIPMQTWVFFLALGLLIIMTIRAHHVDRAVRKKTRRYNKKPKQAKLQKQKRKKVAPETQITTFQSTRRKGKPIPQLALARGKKPALATAAAGAAGGIQSVHTLESRAPLQKKTIQSNPQLSSGNAAAAVRASGIAAQSRPITDDPLELMRKEEGLMRNDKVDQNAGKVKESDLILAQLYAQKALEPNRDTQSIQKAGTRESAPESRQNPEAEIRRKPAVQVVSPAAVQKDKPVNGTAAVPASPTKPANNLQRPEKKTKRVQASQLDDIIAQGLTIENTVSEVSDVQKKETDDTQNIQRKNKKHKKKKRGRKKK